MPSVAGRTTDGWDVGSSDGMGPDWIPGGRGQHRGIYFVG